MVHLQHPYGTHGVARMQCTAGRINGAALLVMRNNGGQQMECCCTRSVSAAWSVDALITTGAVF